MVVHFKPPGEWWTTAAATSPYSMQGVEVNLNTFENGYKHHYNVVVVAFHTTKTCEYKLEISSYLICRIGILTMRTQGRCDKTSTVIKFSLICLTVGLLFLSVQSAQGKSKGAVEHDRNLFAIIAHTFNILTAHKNYITFRVCCLFGSIGSIWTLFSWTSSKVGSQLYDSCQVHLHLFIIFVLRKQNTTDWKHQSETKSTFTTPDIRHTLSLYSGHDETS